MNTNFSAMRYPGRLASALLTFCCLIAVLYSVLVFEHVVAFLNGRVDISNIMLGWATSHEFIFGQGSLRYVQYWYEQVPVRMAMHMALGGIALGLGALQFVPSLRRRYPRAHRLSGLIVWVAVLASMIGAFGFLANTPMRNSSSGPAFHIGLWAVGLLTVGLLLQAVLAAMSRDFRSHMIWMALTFAGIATAPMLRINYMIFGNIWHEAGHEAVNLITSGFVLLQTIFLMTLWLSSIGDRDLPGRASAHSAWPKWLLVTLSALSALAGIQEGILAPQGLDLFRAARSVHDLMPPLAGTLWTISMVVAMIALPAAWQAALGGSRPRLLITVASIGVAVSAFWIGRGYPDDVMTRFGTGAFWQAYAFYILAALTLAHTTQPNSLGRNAWSIHFLAFLWLPSQLAGIILFGLLIGMTFDEAIGAAVAVGAGTVLTIGAATGYGATVRLLPAKRKAALQQPLAA